MEKQDWNGKRIAISRTDSIGDVMLTLPLCGWLKEMYPEATLIFIGKSYTETILQQYSAIDEIILWDRLAEEPETNQLEAFGNARLDAIVHVFPQKHIARLAKKARIPYRIGTSHRLFHRTTCNIRPNFTRKKSPLHEAQLNFELLRPFGITAIPSWEDLQHYTRYFFREATNTELPVPLHKPYVILHPKSQGSAREWPIEKYVELAEILIDKGYHVYFTGTDKEGSQFRHSLPKHPACIDTTGKLSMLQLIVLIQQAHALVACSTGPLHLAGFLNIRAIGLFVSKRPMHPGRWKPLGEKSRTLVFDEQCPGCASKEPCMCIQDIPVKQVVEVIGEIPA